MPPAPARETVASTDGVDVVIHHLAPGPIGSPLLVAHATGFHARAYRPMAATLADRFDGWGHDSRGHGSTPAPEGWNVDWSRYGDDATAAATWIAQRAAADRPLDGDGLVGFGHSMGGAALLMAAHREPHLFRALVLFEPIAFPPLTFPSEAGGFDPDESPMVQAARRRRRGFASYQAAIDNYRSKRPMNDFDPRALDEYVYGGLRPVDPDDPDGPVELACDPQLEAATFANGRFNGLWPLLASISTPTLVIGGPPDEANPPARFAEPLANELPHGRYQVTRLEHAGPFVDPDAVADIVREFAG